VTVIAQVISIQAQTTNCVYWLDDGSGRIEARHWMDSSSTEDSEKWGGIKCVNPTIPSVIYLFRNSENTYVRVTGTLKMFGSKRYINATYLRPCADPHELYFHLSEAMTVDLIFERGMVNTCHSRSFGFSNI
jgi:replication factor A2